MATKSRKAEGQGDLFLKPPPPSHVMALLDAQEQRGVARYDYLEIRRQRLPIPLRGGTHLDHRFTVDVWADTPMRGVRDLFGHIDRSQRCFQSGGEHDEEKDENGVKRHGAFYFRKKELISMPEEVWETITHGPDESFVDVIEMVDHPKFRVFCIPRDLAEQHVKYYNAGIGPRVGVKEMYWQVFPFDCVGVRVRGKRLR